MTDKNRTRLEKRILSGVIMYNALELCYFLKPKNFTEERAELFALLRDMEDAINPASVAHRIRDHKTLTLWHLADACTDHTIAEQVPSLGLMLLEIEFRDHAVRMLSAYTGKPGLDMLELHATNEVLVELQDSTKDIFKTLYGAMKFFRHEGAHGAGAVVKRIIESMDARTLELFSETRVKELERKLAEAKAILNHWTEYKASKA